MSELRMLPVFDREKETRFFKVVSMTKDAVPTELDKLFDSPRECRAAMREYEYQNRNRV